MYIYELLVFWRYVVLSIEFILNQLKSALDNLNEFYGMLLAYYDYKNKNIILNQVDNVKVINFITKYKTFNDK